MNRITITLHIDVPEGTVPDVSYGQGKPEVVPSATPPPSAAPEPSYAPTEEPPPPWETNPIAPDNAGTVWTCPTHGKAKVVPAGVSKKTNKPYTAFVVCPERDCEQRPPKP